MTIVRMMQMASAGSAGAEAGIEYVGSVSRDYIVGGNWDSSDRLDVLSVASVGDLAVVAFTFDSNSNLSWSWGGMNFTSIEDRTDQVSPGNYVGYRIIEAGDSNPYLIDVTNTFLGFGVIVSVFNGVSSFVDHSASRSSTQMPNPPALTASGGLWVVTGHLDDDINNNWGAPTNYTLAASQDGDNGALESSTAIAYRIAALTSDDPSTFTGSGSDANFATTIAFS